MDGGLTHQMVILERKNLTLGLVNLFGFDFHSH
jgi:hypothetical protein